MVADSTGVGRAGARRAIDELLDSGPLLWHPQESMQSPLAHSWLLVESAEWEQVGGQGTWAHLATLGVTQVARPAVTTTDPRAFPAGVGMSRWRPDGRGGIRVGVSDHVGSAQGRGRGWTQ